MDPNIGNKLDHDKPKSQRKNGHVPMDSPMVESLRNGRIKNASNTGDNDGTDDDTKQGTPQCPNPPTVIVNGAESDDGSEGFEVGQNRSRKNSNESGRRISNTSSEKFPPVARLLHPGYLKNPSRSNIRKVSAFSQSSLSDQGSLINQSRKTSTVLFEERPEIIHPQSNSGNGTSDVDASSDYKMSSRMSVFSVYSRPDRASLQSDVTFRDQYEVLPSIDHYRNMINALDTFRQRPTMQQLREEQIPMESIIGGDLEDSDDDEDEKADKTKDKVKEEKLGWVQGVLVRCLLNIFGVMLFLRLTWITGQAGIGLASVVILLSAFVTSVTTMSMAAICTNGEVKGGGAYYMISRSLGPEFGGAIGVVFSLANAVAAAMYVVGFAETVRDIMWEYGAEITGNALHEVRIIGIVTCFLILGIVLIGLDFESKAQLVLLFILIVAIINYFVGTFLPAGVDKQVKGFVGYSGGVFLQNLGPDFRGTSFFQVFSIFFPAATGILAGANISGDLKDPSSAIPKGTFLAIILTTIIYLGMVWSVGGCMLRDAVGLSLLAQNVSDGADMSFTLTEISQCGNSTCTYGLQNDNGAVGIASAFKPLILAGIFSATLSSALASLVSAPKVFQALGKDKLFPFIGYFSKGYGKTGEPKRGYFLTFAICVAMTCIGALDVIAPIISNFFLMAYALINFSCFDVSFSNTPGFRPSFKLYNKWVSLLGSLLCLAVMFLINWWAALVTFVIITALYVYIKHRKPDVNWGSSSQAHAYKDALGGALKLADTDEHIKNFRPQILVLSGYPRNRPALVDFVSTITQKQSLLICGHVLLGDMSIHTKNIRSTAAYKWFKNRNIRAFYSNISGPNLRIGVQPLIQTTGIGKLTPNTVVLGFKNDWQVDDPRVVYGYYRILHDAFDLNYGVGVLRVAEGFDVHKVPDHFLADTNEEVDDWDTLDQSDEETSDQSDEEVDTQKEDEKTNNNEQGQGEVKLDLGDLETKLAEKASQGEINSGYDSDSVSLTVEDSPQIKVKRLRLTKGISVDDERLGNRFRRKQQGTIDVWWLFDDGGLTLLVPYILSTRKQWKDCKLRVFCAGTKKSTQDEDERKMAALLKKFRIDYSQITVLTSLKKKPKRATYKEFESMVYRWRLRPDESQIDLPWKITSTDMLAQKQKTYMNLRLRELLLEHSSQAGLVVLTLPVLRKMSCPAGLYMTWLEMLTSNLPPTLLLRGNQESVLTYFS